MLTHSSHVEPRPVHTSLWVTFSLLLCGVTLQAQEVTGTLYGRLADASGLPLPGATVTISSPQLFKGAQVLTTTERGLYRAPVLPPGTYSVKAEMAGFQTASSDDIQLKAGMALAVDFTLKLASVQESVTVVAESPLDRKSVV